MKYTTRIKYVEIAKSNKYRTGLCRLTARSKDLTSRGARGDSPETGSDKETINKKTNDQQAAGHANKSSILFT